MGDLLRVLLDSIAYVWPLKRCNLWERALYIACGRWKFEVGPGLYLVPPFFCELHALSMAWDVQHLARHDITTRDGRGLSFEAVATMRISNLQKALLLVHDYERSTEEMVGSLLAEKLAEIEPERLLPDRRSRLVNSLVGWVQDEAAAFGVEVSRIRFSSFVLNARTVRLLVDHGASVI